MKRQELEQNLGKYVVIELYDGTLLFGYLHSNFEKEYWNQPNLDWRYRYYFIIDTNFLNESKPFRLSWITRISSINEVKFYG